jgi:ABC-type branched-subunit amino acid transport system permease subunit
MAMVGGAGYLLGAVLGSALVTLMKNSIQDILMGWRSSIAGPQGLVARE